MTEQTLSEKILRDGSDDSQDLIFVSEVKEFIKKLKEEMQDILKINVDTANNSGVSDKLKQEVLEMMQGNIIELNDRLDKLAGEKLICK